MLKSEKIVHALRRGFPVCKFTKKIASKWPSGCTYGRAAAAEQDARIFEHITCTKCALRLEGRTDDVVA